MLETILSTIAGGLVGWVTTHIYYLKQEKASPTPLINEINTKVQSLANLEGLRNKIEQLYDLTVEKNDVELQVEVKSLIRESLEKYLEILNSLLPYDLMIQNLQSAYNLDEMSFRKEAARTLPELTEFNNTFKSVRDELFGLLEMTESLGKGQNSRS